MKKTIINLFSLYIQYRRRRREKIREWREKVKKQKTTFGKERYLCRFIFTNPKSPLSLLLLLPWFLLSRSHPFQFIIESFSINFFCSLVELSEIDRSLFTYFLYESKHSNLNRKRGVLLILLTSSNLFFLFSSIFSSGLLRYIGLGNAVFCNRVIRIQYF